MTVRVSVIIPSRLRVDPYSTQGGLYLDRALGGIDAQARGEVEIEKIVGIDKDHPPIPPQNAGSEIAFVEAGRSQAAALNRAAERATGDYLAICEDDDLWHEKKLEIQLSLMLTGGFDFVSCSQHEFDPSRNQSHINNFPTPSGWIMKQDVWRKVGGFDETFRFHLDNEWLGRLNKVGVKRVHLVPAGTEDPDNWLATLSRYSKIAVVTAIREPLVSRYVASDGGMAVLHADLIKLAKEFAAERREGPRATSMQQADEMFAQWCRGKDSPGGISMREHKIIFERYGTMPF
jgi:glycosyltransferase involved in cell wall biosynthesis